VTIRLSAASLIAFLAFGASAGGERPATDQEGAGIAQAVAHYLALAPSAGASGRFYLYPLCVSSHDPHYASAQVWLVTKYGFRGDQPFAVLLRRASNWGVVGDTSGQGVVSWMPARIERELNSKNCFTIDHRTRLVANGSLTQITYAAPPARRFLIHGPNVGLLNVLQPTSKVVDQGCGGTLAREASPYSERASRFDWPAYLRKRSAALPENRLARACGRWLGERPR
jgi:hypothetical protein